MENCSVKVDKISSNLKNISNSLEKKKKIIENYTSTLNEALAEWKSGDTSDESLENLTKLRRKFSIVNLLMQRLVTSQVSLHSDIELFEKFAEEKSLLLVIEWVSTLRFIDSDMKEIADPTIYGLSADVPRSFSDLLKWVPSDNSNELDKKLYGYLQNIDL